MSAAYRQGYEIGRKLLPISLNTHPERSLDSDEWARGWRAGTGAAMFDSIAPRRSATIIPHPNLSAAQCDIVCKREGLALEHVGDGDFELVRPS